MSDNLEIRPAVLADVPGIFSMLLRMFDEAPLEVLNSQMAHVEITRVVRQEAAWVVLSDGGDLVATCGLTEGSFWFSGEPILVTRWLYALPEQRGDRGAWGLLKTELAKFSEAVDMSIYLDLHNPLRSRRASRLERAFERFSYHPRGVRLRMKPGEAA